MKRESVENKVKTINSSALSDELTGLRELLDCACAIIYVLTEDKGGKFTVSREKVKNALGKYSLNCIRNKDGDYELNLTECISG